MQTQRFPGRYESLAKIGNFIEQAAEQAGLDSKAVYHVQVAVDEACANVIDHAYGGEDVGEIEVSHEDTGRSFKVVVRDWGKSFVPGDIPEPEFDKPLEEMPSRGAGIMFMRKHMDEVEYKFSKKHGNTVTMLKHK